MGAYGFEGLEVYKLAVGVARWVRTVRWPARTTSLRDQAERASQSVVLNIAEGWSRSDGNRRVLLQAALGSAGEVLAVLDIVALPGGDEQQQVLRRIGAMLARSAR